MNNDYDYIEGRMVPILVGKLLFDAGRACDYLCEFDDWEIDGDCYYDYIISGLTCAGDFWNVHINEASERECWYFSDARMMEFYRLCRCWSRQRGTFLHENPYILEAERFVQEQLSLNSYCYDYVLKTKVNHQWASGIAFYRDPEFNQEYRLLEGLLKIYDHYAQKSLELRHEIWAQEIETRGKLLYLPAPSREVA